MTYPSQATLRRAKELAPHGNAGSLPERRLEMWSENNPPIF